MLVRGAFSASLLGVFGYASIACANSCANVDVIGGFDESGLRETAYGIYATGTFRIEGEREESKQPNFNLTTVRCEKDHQDSVGLECRVTQAIVVATPDKPNPDEPNCSLDLNYSDYSMKELQKGVFTGMELSTTCWDSILTIDRNKQRVYLSFTRSQDADKTLPSVCGKLPRTQVLMNCTGWPRIRKHGQTPPRYCDFSSASDKR